MVLRATAGSGLEMLHTGRDKSHVNKSDVQEVWNASKKSSYSVKRMTITDPVGENDLMEVEIKTFYKPKTLKPTDGGKADVHYDTGQGGTELVQSTAGTSDKVGYSEGKSSTTTTTTSTKLVDKDAKLYTYTVDVVTQVNITVYNKGMVDSLKDNQPTKTLYYTNEVNLKSIIKLEKRNP